jgi:hypothetical protein
MDTDEKTEAKITDTTEIKFIMYFARYSWKDQL